MRLPGGAAVVELRPPAPGSAEVTGRAWLTDSGDLASVLALCRRVLDLDADPGRIDAALAADPALNPLVLAAPGRRVPGSPDAAELAIRAVLGQQVSTAAARTHAGRLVAAYGEPVTDPAGGLVALFPTPAALVALRPAELALPEVRKRTLIGLVHALDEGRVTLDAEVHTVRRQLSALPGIGPWTVETVAMRAYGDADAFLPGDLGVRVAAEALGLPTRPAALEKRSRVWSPWRAYAVQHLWATGTHAVNRLPA